MLSCKRVLGGSVNIEVGLQQAKSERARAAICDATIASLAAVGYAETSINRVAAMADFSKGAVQYHFPTKEDLIAATVDALIVFTASTSASSSGTINSTSSSESESLPSVSWLPCSAASHEALQRSPAVAFRLTDAT